MRPQARHYDEHEHEVPWDFINLMWDTALKTGQSFRSGTSRPDQGPSIASTTLVHIIESLSWGDAGIYLCGPGAGLGGAAIEATGTKEQKERFLARFREGKPKWASMAMTEPQCGSDTAAIRTTAVRDGDEWVLNGEKIFVTSGHKSLIDSEGLSVIWATVDPSAGRAGIKSFVVEAGTPGLTVTKLEYKMGIRASDTASIVLQDCRIPLDNLLGSAEVVDRTKRLQRSDGHVRRHAPVRRRQRARNRPRVDRAAERSPGERRNHHPLSNAAQSPLRDRARRDRHGSPTPRRLAADVESHLADGPAPPQHHRILRLQSESGRRRHESHGRKPSS